MARLECYWIEDDGSVHRRVGGEFEDPSCNAGAMLLRLAKEYARMLELCVNELEDLQDHGYNPAFLVEARALLARDGRKA